MNAAGRLGVYGAALVLIFGGAFAAGSAFVPDATVAARQQPAPSGHESTPHASTPHESTPHESTPHESTGPDHGGGGEHPTAQAETETLRGLSLAQDDLVLGPVTTPTKVGKAGELSFTVLGADGKPFTDFAVSHEKELHLIVVRSDGQHFEHVHPTMDPQTGTWSVPWTWTEAGTYRVFTDFVPSGENAPNVTLTRTVEVAGDVTPRPATAVRRTDTVGGYQVSLSGDLAAGESRELTLEVTRNGRPVTTLQPYLGAFGHLVALREGDLAFLHVHAEGEDPAPGATAGPAISFAAEAPTAGRYLLYLDFQVDGTVHTASFVLDAHNHN